MPRLRLLVSLLRRPSSDASSLSPRKPPLRLTWNHCRRHMHRPPSLANTTKACHLANCQPVPCTSSSILRSFGPYSGPRVVGYAYNLFGSYSLLYCMFLYLSFVLDSPLLIASFLLFAFAFTIGHQLLPLLSTLRPLSHLRYTIHSRSFDYHSTFRIRRRAACRQQDFNFASFVLFFPTRSFYRVAYTVSRYLGLVIYISKPSPVERQATGALFSPFSFSCVLGNCGPFLYSLSRLSYRPTRYAFVTVEEYPSAAARITTRVHRPFLLLGAISFWGRGPGFIFISSLWNSRAESPVCDKIHRQKYHGIIQLCKLGDGYKPKNRNRIIQERNT